MAGDSNPPQATRTAPRFDRQIVWAVLSLIYAALAGVIIGFVYDSAISNNAANATGQGQIWFAMAALIIFALLNLPALVISIRTIRRAAQSSIPLAVTLICVMALIVNIWVIVRDIVVVFYVLFLTGTQSGTGGSLWIAIMARPLAIPRHHNIPRHPMRRVITLRRTTLRHL